MFVDASALVAILVPEEDGARLAEAVQGADAPTTSPVAIYEATVALVRIKGASVETTAFRVNEFLAEAGIAVIPITEEIGRAAIEAFDRYGKGRRHPAQLNLGDCFAYAAAKVRSVPLLYKGADFDRTDVRRP